MFRIGQKVVCVDASRGAVTGHTDLVAGRVYVVAGFDPETGNSAIYLIGVPHRKIPFSNTGVGWARHRFRPVVERKTDISIFTAMLTPSPVTVDAMSLVSKSFRASVEVGS